MNNFFEGVRANVTWPSSQSHVNKVCHFWVAEYTLCLSMTIVSQWINKLAAFELSSRVFIVILKFKNNLVGEKITLLLTAGELENRSYKWETRSAYAFLALQTENIVNFCL